MGQLFTYSNRFHSKLLKSLQSAFNLEWNRSYPLRGVAGDVNSVLLMYM